jgi:hypothetical protein
MRNQLALPAVIAAAAALAFSPMPAQALKKVAYPEVKVELGEVYKPDAQFTAMRKAFTDAVKAKDAEAIFKLVGPTFVWTLNSGPIEDFDYGRDALHNFKVVFGFRESGKDTDGGVDNGPFWDDLESFAAEATFNTAPSAGSLVCSPISASYVDTDVLDEARNKIETSDDDQADWYFTLNANTPVMRARNDTGNPIARVGSVALPVLSTFPPSKDDNSVKPTSYEVLLPSGRSGWVAASALKPMQSNQLCFAKTPGGDWKIASFDQTD